MRLVISMIAIAAIAAIAACKKDENPQPDFPDSTPKADAVIDVAIDSPPACYLDAGPQGCFQCEPVALEDFLNACTDHTCVAFDDVARLPLYNGGNLPPLPP